MTTQREADLSPELVEVAKAAFKEALENPRMIECARCKGRGFHHGFGENGHDPDWCEECGGAAWATEEGEEDRPLLTALQAALPLLEARAAEKYEPLVQNLEQALAEGFRNVEKQVREDAAKIADEYEEWTYWGQNDNWRAATSASQEIAEAIRKGRRLTSDEIREIDKKRGDTKLQEVFEKQVAEKVLRDLRNAESKWLSEAYGYSDFSLPVECGGGSREGCIEELRVALLHVLKCYATEHALDLTQLSQTVKE